MNIDFELLKSFAIALAIGALVGVEREKYRDKTGTAAGLRTFSLIALSGALAAWLGETMEQNWLLLVGLVALTIVVMAPRFLSTGEQDTGLTTLVAANIVYLLGATVLTGYTEIAIALGVTVSALLAFREPLHGIVHKIGTDDLFAGLKLLIATFIILPIIPNETLDPWGAFNPFKVWLLAILISALSLVGYVAMRLFGSRKGVAATGLSGGMVSSTALTLALARRSSIDGKSAVHRLTTGILLAWTVMYLRILIAVSIIFPPLLKLLSGPCLLFATACAGIAWYHWRQDESSSEEKAVDVKNPFSLLQATQFALVFAAIMFVVRLSEHYLPPSSIYGVASLAGLVDVDAITLSISSSAQDGGPLGQAAIAILLASLTNTLTKAGMVLALGDRSLRRPILLASVALLALTGAAIGWIAI